MRWLAAGLLIILAAAVGGAVLGALQSTSTTSAQPPGTPAIKRHAGSQATPTPMPLPDTPTPPIAGAGQTGVKAFGANLRQLLGVESRGFQDIESADIEPGNGHQAIPLINGAFDRFKRAADVELGGPPTPFDDVGYDALNATIDEQTVAQDMLLKYGDQDISGDRAQIEADHQKLLDIQERVRAHGG